MPLNPLFWKDKKVLITGHSGFVGSWISLWLHKLEAKVSGIALSPNTSPSLFSLLSLDKEIDSTFLDIRDYGSLSKKIKAISPDVIFHLAAQPLVRYSYENPRETYETNVMGTVNLLDCFRTSKDAKVLLNVTTDKCYSNKEWIWGYRESDELGGHDPYSNSKACSELVSSAYRNSFFSMDSFENHGKVLATARAGNILGGGDWSEDRLIPDLIRSFSKKECLNIRNPNATRPWLYVLDAISGYLSLTEKLWETPSLFSGEWNFSPSSEESHSVRAVVEKAMTIWPEEIQWDHEISNQVHEANFLKLDSSKARKYLNWSPQKKIDEIMESTLNWYIAYFNHEDLMNYSTQEITKYSQKLTEKVLI
ncbi:MAG: CDP-glucose 4,6-dehydratase [Chlamydiae bacterium]|nr:CDP-glucose 4,6-dehydratase [Chlamydiota bacterium]